MSIYGREAHHFNSTGAYLRMHAHAVVRNAPGISVSDVADSLSVNTGPIDVIDEKGDILGYHVVNPNGLLATIVNVRRAGVGQSREPIYQLESIDTRFV